MRNIEDNLTILTDIISSLILFNYEVMETSFYTTSAFAMGGKNPKAAETSWVKPALR